MTKTTQKLKLEELLQSVPDLSEYWTLARLEALLVCLEHHQHQSETLLEVEDYDNYILIWDSMVSDIQKRTWNDLQEATEKGAEGLAALIIRKVTPYKIISRAVKGTGIDYWLAYDDNDLPFQKSARLEVSGILKGTESQIKYRTKLKAIQSEQSISSQLPVFVVVVEFSIPKVKIEEK